MDFHAKDLRVGRFSSPGIVYLITAVTNNRQKAFIEHQIARILIKTMKNADEKKYSSTLGFVVMPDHLHWIFKLGKSKDLSSTVKYVKGSSAIQINRYSQNLKFQWQPGFHDHAIRNDESLVAVMRYVIANPLRAGIVESIGDYPSWDSVYL